MSYKQCCGSGSGRIRNYLHDPDPDPELIISDPDPAQLDLNSLVNNPNFDFISNISTLPDNSTDFDLIYSPYLISNFHTSYTDTHELIAKINNSKFFTSLSLNIQSLASKYNELKDLINILSSSNSLPDVVCLQETWAVCGADLFPLPGYQPLVFSTRSKSRGGGVGIYIRSGISFRQCPSKSQIRKY
jgi:hypothetical protein